jgi:hypothetical protein
MNVWGFFMLQEKKRGTLKHPPFLSGHKEIRNPLASLCFHLHHADPSTPHNAAMPVKGIGGSLQPFNRPIPRPRIKLSNRKQLAIAHHANRCRFHPALSIRQLRHNILPLAKRQMNSRRNLIFLDPETREARKLPLFLKALSALVLISIVTRDGR